MILFTSVGLTYIIYNTLQSDDTIKGKEKISNSKKIKLQMNREEVYIIMGKPDTIINNRACYTTNDDSYPYIELSFDSTEKVVEIYSPEKNNSNR